VGLANPGPPHSGVPDGAQRGRLAVLVLTENKFWNASRAGARLQASWGKGRNMQAVFTICTKTEEFITFYP